MQTSIHNDVQSSASNMLFTATASAFAKPSVMQKPSYSKRLVMNAISRPDMNRSHSQSAISKPSL
jgi:beta-mannanase